MKKLNLIILILLFGQFVYAQITFQKTFGGIGDNQGYCVQQTSDGGYIMVGKSNNFGLGYTDIFIIKTDANGDTTWTKEMGSTGIDQIHSVRETAGGGFILAGVFAPPPSTVYAFLMKMNSSGNIIWTHAYGNNPHQDAKCVQQTSDGGYILCGNIVAGATSNDYMLLKTNSAGVTSWAKHYGGTSSQFGLYVEQTTDGGFIFSGSNGGTIELIKTNGSGNLVWSKNYGNGRGNCVRQTNDGGYIISGYSWNTSLGTEEIFLKKADYFGNLLWSYRYGGVNNERGHFVTQTTDGGYIISGTTTVSGISELLLVKTDSTGAILWSKVYGQSGFCDATSVQQTSDGGYIILGKYGNSTDNSFYLVKTDSFGASGCNQADTTIFRVTDTTQATIVTNTDNNIGLGNPVPTMSIVGLPTGMSFNSLCFSNAINEQTDYMDELGLAPNPSIGNFAITFDDQVISGNIEVVNALGERVYRQTITNVSLVNINLNNVVAGIYFVKVFNEKKSYSRKLIIAH